MKELPKYFNPQLFLLVLVCLISFNSFAQIDPPTARTDTIAPMPPMAERSKNWGPNDTVIVSAIWYQNEMMPYKEMENVWISKLSGRKLAKYIEEWNRLRNAVYVTYPYARIAGSTINDMNVHLAGVDKKKNRKEYI